MADLGTGLALDTEADPWAPPAEGGPAGTELPPVTAESVSVPGQYHSLKWWKLVLTLIGVWIPAAAIGAGLYYWWVQDFSAHKTLPVFMVLVYVVVCAVGSLLLAMIDRKPLIAALAIAVMSAPFASCAGAAPVYGHYFCAYPQPKRCVVGVIPY